MLSRFVVLLVITSSSFSCAYKESKNSEYDQMCDYVQDVLSMDMGQQQKFDYIEKYFSTRVKSKDVKEAYDLIYQISPDQRYKVFKGAVESSSNEQWDCVALEQLFNLRK